MPTSKLSENHTSCDHVITQPSRQLEFHITKQTALRCQKTGLTPINPKHSSVQQLKQRKKQTAYQQQDHDDHGQEGGAKQDEDDGPVRFLEDVLADRDSGLDDGTGRCGVERSSG